MNEKDKACPCESAKINTHGTGKYNSKPKDNEIIDTDELQKTARTVLINAHICPSCGFIAIFQDVGKKLPDHRCPFCSNESEEWILNKIEQEPQKPIIVAEGAV